MLNVTPAEQRIAGPSSSSLATLEAMAVLARQTASIVHVIVPRERGVVERARVLAENAGVDVSVDLMPLTVRCRFGGQIRQAS